MQIENKVFWYVSETLLEIRRNENIHWTWVYNMRWQTIPYVSYPLREKVLSQVGKEYREADKFLFLGVHWTRDWLWGEGKQERKG